MTAGVMIIGVDRKYQDTTFSAQETSYWMLPVKQFQIDRVVGVNIKTSTSDIHPDISADSKAVVASRGIQFCCYKSLHPPSGLD